MRGINLVSHWFDSAGIRIPDLPQGKLTALPIGSPRPVLLRGVIVESILVSAALGAVVH